MIIFREIALAASQSNIVATKTLIAGEFSFTHLIVA